MRAAKIENKRRQILDGSAKIFAKKGYHNASISDICAKSNVARATFYIYFKNKREVFDLLIKHFSRLVLSKITLLSEDSAIQQFNTNIKIVVELIIKNRDMSKIVVSEAVGLDSEFNHQLILFYARLVEHIEGALVRIVKEKMLPDDANVRFLAYSVLGLIKEIVYQWAIDKGNILDVDPLIDDLRNFDLLKFIVIGEKKHV